MPVAPGPMRRNRLLAAAPDPVRERLAEVGALEPMDFKQLLLERGERIERVVFPIVGVVSLLSVTDGGIVEVATVGNEGFVGLPVFLQATLMSAHRSIAQIPGEGVFVPAEDFLELSNSGGPFQAALMRYAQALMTQISQSAACNRLHGVMQRCARWLLLTHDRVAGDAFELNQEFLGQMLGTSRQAVDEAARRLAEQAVITYTRGRVTVIDRVGLEAESCECYDLVRAEFDRLLPSPSSDRRR